MLKKNKQITKKQHQVPKFWAKKWNTLKNNQKVVCGYNHKFTHELEFFINKKHHLSNDKQLQTWKLYENDHLRVNSVEHGLSRIETGAANSIKQLERYFASELVTSNLSKIDIIFIVTLINISFQRSKYLFNHYNDPNNFLAHLPSDNEITYSDLFSINIKLRIELALKLIAKNKYNTGKLKYFETSISKFFQNPDLLPKKINSLEDLLGFIEFNSYFFLGFERVSFIYFDNQEYPNANFVFHNLCISINSKNKYTNFIANKIRELLNIPKEKYFYVTAITPKILIVVIYPSSKSISIEKIKREFDQKNSNSQFNIFYEISNDIDLLKLYNQTVVNFAKHQYSDIIFYQHKLFI